jgi:hypothetical protein
MLKHKVCIGVSKQGEKMNVLKAGQKTMRNKLLDFLLGGKIGVFVLTPGASVESVEIREIQEGGLTHDARQS